MVWNWAKPFTLEALTVAVTIVTFGSCDDVVIEGSSGSFVSPNYPSKYDHNVHQVYRARLGTPGPQQVQLDYVVNLEGIMRKGGEECWDRLSIPAISLVLCGQTTGTTYLTIEGNEFNMTFMTDDSVASPGFNATFSVLQGNCTATLDVTPAPDTLYQWMTIPITDMLTRNSVVLTVRCCWSLRIRLTHMPAASSGDRRRVLIAGYGRPVKTHLLACSGETGDCFKVAASNSFTNPNVTTNCCTFRTFWVRWNATTVELGSGSSVGLDTLLLQTTPFSMHVRFFHVLGRARVSNVVAFDAPLPDSYCQNPASIPPPPENCTESTPSVTTAVSVITSTHVWERSSPHTSSADTVTVENHDVIVNTSDDVTTTASSANVSNGASSNSHDGIITTDVVTKKTEVNRDITADDLAEDTTTSGDVMQTRHETEAPDASADGVTATLRVQDNTFTETTPTSKTTVENGKDVTATRTPATRMEVTSKDPVKYHNFGKTCMREHCTCNCVQNIRNTNQTLLKQRKQKTELTEEDLLIKETSARARRYISTRDDRPSSKYLTVFVGTVCFLPLLAIVVYDCKKLFETMYAAVRAKTHTHYI